MKKTKEQLKNLFANGCIPNGNSFADLIDSMNSDEDLAALLAKLNQRIADSDAKNRQLLLDFGGKIKQALHDSDSKLTQKINDVEQNLSHTEQHLTQQLQQLQAKLANGPYKVAADGQWHTVEGTGNGSAFAIVAMVNHGSGCAAVTRADVLRGVANSASGGRIAYEVQQPMLEFWRRISLQWDKQELQIKTASKYKENNGLAAQIQYVITCLW